MTTSQTVKRAGIAGAVLLLAGGAYAGGTRLLGDPARPVTDDAYVAADYTLVAPKVSGLIAEVLVEDNQAVQAGQLLARIDDRDYRTALAAAEADVATAAAQLDHLSADLDRQQALITEAEARVRADDAALTLAHAGANRYRALASSGAGTLEQQQQADAQLDQQLAGRQRDVASVDATRKQVPVLEAQKASAAGALQKAQAARDQAQLNLDYTRITAPIAGTVGQREVRVGAYVNIGHPLLAVLPLAQAYVLANYREVQLAHVRAGQPVTVNVDALPGVTLRGHVDSVAPATGVTFAPVGA
ncbi:MAG: HlyD family secretion protein [Azospirillaceae bacterium]|nr:HlyD family secretion protein [Azospirillaceae bacterium]